MIAKQQKKAKAFLSKKVDDTIIKSSVEELEG